MDTLIGEVYTNPRESAGFSGVEALYRRVRATDSTVTRRQIKDFLHRSNTYTLHYPITQRGPTNKTWSSWIDSDHQADLCVLIDIARHNDGYAYVLCVSDVLSRYVWCEPQRTKSAKDTAAAYAAILRRSQRPPFRLYTDAGREFVNDVFQRQLLRRLLIEHRIPKNHDVKCALAESLVKRLKMRLYRYFTENSTLRYVDVLQDVVHAINNTPSRVLCGLAPAQVNKENASMIWHSMYDDELRKQPRHKYVIGDRVRLVRRGQQYRKGYKPTTTEEVFIIRKLLFREPAAYIIEDGTGEEIDSIVYESELVRYDAAETT